MTHPLRLVLLQVAVLVLAGLTLTTCADRNAPDAAYLQTLHSWNSSRLMEERAALRAEEDTLTGRLAETRTGELPDTAREAALASLENSLRTAQAKRRAVEQVLTSGQYARGEMRYPVRQLVLRPDSPTPPEGPAAQSTPVQPASPDAPQAAPAPESPRTPAAKVAAPDRSAPDGSAAAQPAPAAGAPGATPPPAPAGPARVLGVETARTDAGLEVRVRLAGSPTPRLFTLAGPPRIVLDIPGVAEPAFPLSGRALGAPEAQALRLGWHGEAGYLRLVLDTDAAHLGRASLERTPDGLVLRVAP